LTGGHPAGARVEEAERFGCLGELRGAEIARAGKCCTNSIRPVLEPGARSHRPCSMPAFVPRRTAPAVHRHDRLLSKWGANRKTYRFLQDNAARPRGDGRKATRLENDDPCGRRLYIARPPSRSARKSAGRRCHGFERTSCGNTSAMSPRSRPAPRRRPPPRQALHRHAGSTDSARYFLEAVVHVIEYLGIIIALLGAADRGWLLLSTIWRGPLLGHPRLARRSRLAPSGSQRERAEARRSFCVPASRAPRRAADRDLSPLHPPRIMNR